MKRRNIIKAIPTVAAAGGLAALNSSARAASAESADPLAEMTENLNPVIRKNREVALSILKPSKKDLEHGLRLHAESLVFDGYGFSPRSAIDGAALKKAVMNGASDIEVADMREEMMMTQCAKVEAERIEYESAWRASGVNCVFQNAGQEGQDPMRLIKRLANFTFTTDMMKSFVEKAATPEDIERIRKEGRRSLYFTGNGVPITQQWVSIPDEFRYVKVFYNLGIRMMHLTYQRRNMIGDGCGEKANAGLSDFGRAVIAEMNRVGIVPDCAHSGWQTSLESAQVSSLPVVASHSVAGGIYAHIRSKPDNILKAIADSGGYIGICCIPRYLRGKGDISAFLDHIDYVKKKFGIDHVAIGTDVGYNSRNAGKENGKAAVSGLRRRRKDFRSLWPKDDFLTTPEMTQSVAWTNWPLYTVGMVQRGYSDEEIKKVLSGNVMRVARATLKDHSR